MIIIKKKYANYPNWKRVKKKSYINKYFNNKDFKGNISLLTAIKVNEKLVVNNSNKEIILIDDNYKWLEFYPDNNKNIAISACFNDKDEIQEWYFDIAKNSSLTDDGIPYIEDLYLDIIMYPDGKIIIVDEDELKEALESNIISKEDFDLAYEVTNSLIKKIEGNVENLKKFTYKYYNKIKTVLS